MKRNSYRWNGSGGSTRILHVIIVIISIVAVLSIVSVIGCGESKPNSSAVPITTNNSVNPTDSATLQAELAATLQAEAERMQEKYAPLLAEIDELSHKTPVITPTTTTPSTTLQTAPPKTVTPTFHGYDCTSDCSGHEAGYNWAEENEITDPYDCDGNSESFIEGCQAYAEEYQSEYSDDTSGDENFDEGY